jgi:NAD/NADP transhydrogenase beta subunit
VLAIRCVCAAYWLLLTTLLLVPNPLALLGIRRIPGDPRMVSVHFLSFAMLAALVLASRMPLGRVLVAGLLVGYAIATELLQRVVPTRTPTPEDLLANLLGLVTGAAVWWGAQKYLRRRPSRHK